MGVRPSHDAQGCWARHDQLTNATLAASFGTQNRYGSDAPRPGGVWRRAGTCHNADSPRTVAMTILPTQGLAAWLHSIPLHVGRGAEWVVHATGDVVGRGARHEFLQGVPRLAPSERILEMVSTDAEAI